MTGANSSALENAGLETAVKDSQDRTREEAVVGRDGIEKAAITGDADVETDVIDNEDRTEKETDVDRDGRDIDSGTEEEDVDMYGKDNEDRTEKEAGFERDGRDPTDRTLEATDSEERDTRDEDTAIPVIVIGK
ncbi:uncharacterized protein LOC127750119 isoform X1 [Frankliniella occidentalis]|uniref:Uncharacterized protein LOC127750119 isoform X1 n=1 Tax=Frankliniella occidentalis TaxID=133901 RepID=A0A9C6UEN0_FRAOC|nr:uncharacterized protein LOC127750119 isoform X1 [Frankliniella occidentalis]